jgi:hypothetical protein
MDTPEHQPVPPTSGRYPPRVNEPESRTTPPAPEAAQSAVSWAAILAGATVTAVLSLILLLLGVGLGMAVVSPWAMEGIDADTFGWATIIWISLSSIIAGGLGGYLAGRLRTKWVAVHADEAYFRDTAHGFLSWAVATLLTAALLTSAVGAIISGGLQAGAAAAGTVAGGVASGGELATQEADAAGVIDYFVDRVLRAERDPDDAEPNDERIRGEAVGIFATSLRHGELDDEDARYLAQLVAQRTGLSEQEARSRVEETHQAMVDELEDAETRARELADEAREATIYASLWLFITMLMGAFVASLMATFGGRQRDNL